MSTSTTVPSLESTYFSGTLLQLYSQPPPDCPENTEAFYEENAFIMTEIADRLDASIARSVPVPPRSLNVSIVLDKRLLCSTRRITHVWTTHVQNSSSKATSDPVYFGEVDVFDPFVLLDSSVSLEPQSYQRLQSLYGAKVPRFYGHFVAPLPSQRNRTVNVVLMEYIHGRDIRDLATQEKAGALCPTHKDTLIDAALRLYFGIYALGVEQRDMQPRNVILRPRRKDGPFCSTTGCPLRYEADCKDMQMTMVDFEWVKFRNPDGQFSDPVTQMAHVEGIKPLYH
ncbi:hypothetical protein IW261DRAFT_1562610 [Armillaria novae-zelandiae]|uniref:Protein kinase domain-containing protein n=1 Tax=Armillaria novae-zelandiae TaxID=153914 RepID=A0AA39PCZ3_9AGAR|nr:hypothetical protein IW261DRAFT_1562610 [Armillaria novae-zelandiae]